MQYPPELDALIPGPDWPIDVGFGRFSEALEHAEAGLLALERQAAELFELQDQVDEDVGAGDAAAEIDELRATMRSGLFLALFSYFEGHVVELAKKFEEGHGAPVDIESPDRQRGSWARAEFLLKQQPPAAGAIDKDDLNCLRLLRILRNELSHRFENPAARSDKRLRILYERGLIGRSQWGTMWFSDTFLPESTDVLRRIYLTWSGANRKSTN